MQSTSQSLSFFVQFGYLFIFGFFLTHYAFLFLFFFPLLWGNTLKGKDNKDVVEHKMMIKAKPKYACGLYVKRLIHQQKIFCVSSLRFSFFLPFHFYRIFFSCRFLGCNFLLRKILHKNLFSGCFPNIGEIFYLFLTFFLIFWVYGFIVAYKLVEKIDEGILYYRPW